MSDAFNLDWKVVGQYQYLSDPEYWRTIQGDRQPPSFALPSDHYLRSVVHAIEALGHRLDRLEKEVRSGQREVMSYLARLDTALGKALGSIEVAHQPGLRCPECEEIKPAGEFEDHYVCRNCRS